MSRSRVESNFLRRITRLLPVSRSLIIVRKGSRHGEDENHITISNSCHAVTASSHFRDLSLSLSLPFFFFFHGGARSRIQVVTLPRFPYACRRGGPTWAPCVCTHTEIGLVSRGRRRTWDPIEYACVLYSGIC